MTASWESYGITFRLMVPPPWCGVDRENADAALEWEHPSGLRLMAKFHAGWRNRLEVSCLPTTEIASAPAPKLSVVSAQPLIAWLGGASGEIVALSASGPVHANQLRGFATGSLTQLGIFPEPLVLAPGHPLTSVWLIEQLPGDLFTVPDEPGWLPARRHVPHGDQIELRLPDSVLTGVSYEETESGFLLSDQPGLHTIEVGGANGISKLEVGWFLDWRELVQAARAGASEDDLWCYLGTLVEAQDLPELLGRLERALENPTLWGVLAAGNLAAQGRFSFEEARRAGETILSGAEVPEKIALITRGLASPNALLGVRLGALAYDGLSRFGMGRVMSDYPDGAEPELLTGWFWLAGLGESTAGIRVASMLGAVQARALCRASQSLDPVAVAWLSLNS